MSTPKPRPETTDKRAAALAAAAKNSSRAERKSLTVAITILVLALAAFAGTVAFIFSNSASATLGEVDQPSTANSAGAIVLGSGGLGTPNDGAPVVEIYSDYMCSYCAMFDGINGQTLTDLAEAGDIELNFHLVSILDTHTSTQYSTRAASAAATVAHEAPDAFVAFHTALLAQQPSGNPDGLTDAELGQLAVSAGVPADVAATFGDTTFKAFIAATTTAAFDAEVTSTPTIVIDGTVMDPAVYDWTQAGTVERAIGELAK